MASSELKLSVNVELTDASRIIPLRGAVLRAGWPLEESKYPGDALPSTFHLAAFVGERLVGCCTGLLASNDLCPGAMYQLRGMAVAPDLQGTGVGAALLNVFNKQASLRGAESIWCNARISARPFYQRAGWSCIGETFEIIEIPHVVMHKTL